MQEIDTKLRSHINSIIESTNDKTVDFNVINNWTLKHLEVAAAEVAEFLIEINKKEK